MKLILLKLGGSLITEKDKPYTLRPDIIKQVVRQITEVYSTQRNFNLILANGAGSFAHQSATKYDTIHGFKDPLDVYGACHVHTDAIQLHYELLRECINQKLPVFSIQPSSIFIAENTKPSFSSLQQVEFLLSNGMIPFLYGDVILDTKIGATIFSTDKIITLIGEYCKEKNLYSDITIVHAGRYDGVLDMQKKVIPLISHENYEKMCKSITLSEHQDVTGGMLTKVEESLNIAKKGIDSLIINGEKAGYIKNALLGTINSGTRITA